MNSARRKLIAWLAGLTLLASVAAVVVARDAIVERWYIYRLDSDDAETVDRAATRLAAMGSIRAIRPLIEQVPREATKGRTIVGIQGRRSSSTPYWPEYWTDSAVLKALYDLSAPAKEAIGQDLNERREEVRVLHSENANLRDLMEAMQEGRSLQYSKERPVQRAQPIFYRALR